MSYPRNNASPERIAVGAVVQISDGVVQTSGVSVSVRGQGGASGAAAGTIAYDNGIVQYTPTQGETDYTSFVVVAYKAGCIPASVTVVTSASGTPGVVSLPSTATIAITGNITGNLSGSVGSVTGAVGSVTGAVGSVTGAVGSVTGNVGGNVSGSVGSVTGAVGSVTGNVGGNVTGSVGSIATGGIATTSFAAGAINAAAIATDAIGSDEISAAAVTKIRSGLVQEIWQEDTSSLVTYGSTSAGYYLADGYGHTTSIVSDLATAHGSGSWATATGFSTHSAADVVTAMGTGTFLTAIPWNAAWDAEVQSECADALTAYGASTLTQTQVTGGAYALNSASFAFNAALDFTTAQKAATLARVTLVDTTTTNTDMRGTDSAALAATALSTATWTATRAGYLDNLSGGAVMLASSYSAPPSVGAIADQVWDEVLSGHLTAGTTGAGLNAAGSAGDPWSTALPGAYGAGTAGYLVGTNLNATVSSRMATYTQPTGFLAATFPGTVASTTNITAASGVTISGTTTTLDALQTAQNSAHGAGSWATATGFSTLDAAGVRTAVGLATANLDTQLADLPTVAEFEARTLVAASYGTAANQSTIIGYIDTEVAAILAAVDTEVGAIKTKTDQLTFTVANQVDANALSGGGGLDAAGVRAAVGLATANLDTQLADIPTVSEFNARTLAAAAYFDPLTDIVTTTDTANITAILADTNELQSDWANGGRLDLILDARSSQASVDDVPTNAELATALGTADDAVLSAIAALNNLSAAQVNAECDTALSDAGVTTARMAALADWIDGGRLDLLLDAILDDTGTAGVALSAAICNKVADHVRRRTQANVEESSDGDTLSLLSEYGAIQQMQESNTTDTAGLLTVKKTDGTTTLGTRTIATDAAADPVTGVS